MANNRSLATKPSISGDIGTQINVESPGRINLIGEHTDYNGGFAMPTAIDKKIYLQFQKNSTSDLCRIFSTTYNTGFEFSLDKTFEKTSGWEDYVLGVVNELKALGCDLNGFDCIIESELPVGAGISSSAALECGIASGLNSLFNLGLSKMDIVRLSQRAENNFVGNQCGIMDQFSSVMSKKGHIGLLDCQNLDFEFIPAHFGNCKLLLLNTNVSHNLANSDYNNRREECEMAVEIIKKDLPKVNSLRDIDFAVLEKYQQVLEPKIYQRCLYVLNENKRVKKAAEALRSGNLRNFGQLMYKSHEGLQQNYEVSCPELDFLVEFSRDKDFIYGSRMMGGGFGGCTINLIEENEIDPYIAEVSKAYFEKFGIKLDTINVSPGEGTIISKRSLA
ncbi:galactokinase [Christiangramia aquimixticola]|uniref:galactokinase n=1 Tax=Christiangramia aquimixticola TaxID=1697558 RepID=UPI003AA896B9